MSVANTIPMVRKEVGIPELQVDAGDREIDRFYSSNDGATPIHQMGFGQMSGEGSANDLSIFAHGQQAIVAAREELRIPHDLPTTTFAALMSMGLWARDILMMGVRDSQSNIRTVLTDDQSGSFNASGNLSEFVVGDISDEGEWYPHTLPPEHFTTTTTTTTLSSSTSTTTTTISSSTTTTTSSSPWNETEIWDDSESSENHSSYTSSSSSTYNHSSWNASVNTTKVTVSNTTPLD